MGGRGRGDFGPRGGFRGGGPPRGGGGSGGGPPGRGGFGGGRGGGPPSGPAIFQPGVPAVPEPRLADAESNALIASLSKLNISDPTLLPLRPNFGKDGRAVNLRTNYYPIKISKREIFEFDMAVEPAFTQRTPKRLRKRVFECMDQSPGFAPYVDSIAHDYSAIAYSAKPIQGNDPQNPLVVRFTFSDEDGVQPKKGQKPVQYKVTLTYIKTLSTTELLKFLNGADRDYDPLPLISALNVILAKYPSQHGGVVVGKNRFFFPQEVRSIGGGLEAWKGFYSSVRPVYKQLMINLNVATTAMYTPGNLAKSMDDFKRSTFNARMTPFFKGVRVQTTHLGYKSKKTVRRIHHQAANREKFQSEEYGMITVEMYFKKKYNITLRRPELPLVDVGATKPNFLPPELCEITPGQHFKGKLSDDHTSQMITVAAQRPAVNANQIQQRGLPNMGFGGNATFMQFEIGIGDQMAVIPGRVLPPPQVAYGKNKNLRADNGNWNLRDIVFHRGARLEKWAVLNLTDDNRDDISDPAALKSLIEGFVGMCKAAGMVVGAGLPQLRVCNLVPRQQDSGTRSKSIGVIRDTIKSLPGKPNIILVVLSNADKHIYAGIKHLCDVVLDVPTVCVQAGKFKKGGPQYYANVSLKFNMKLGGVNHVLHPDNMKWLKTSPTMVCGMDVTHPGPASLRGTPSIAAVVASVDDMFAQYPASLAMQNSRQEMIEDLETLMIERLQAFKKKNGGKLPMRILVFRDGVSEGQFNQVVEIEYPRIQKACTKLDRAYRPKITIAICGKRHHTRFYPTKDEDADRTTNTKAGTVVDRGVTAVYNFDFFLQAHAGLQGTVRPTHYTVVVDDNKFKADEIQRLTHDTSYMFARATKAVSLVAPAYYADIACERGRCYIHELLNSGETDTVTSAGEDEDRVFQDARRLWGAGPKGTMIGESMFYL